jgi:serine/threonine protein kinase
MEAQRWEKLMGLFLPPGERTRFIERNSPDESFRAELRALLDSHGWPGSFLEGLAVDQVAESIADRNEQLRIGQTISHYKVIDFLGAGGMGKVYLAEDTNLNRKVALKLLSSDFPNRKELLVRFEREACAASALNHPNIITVHEIFIEDGLHVIATEFVDGVTLREKLSACRIPLEEAVDIAAQVASALMTAHSAGIVHRDVKPENVMVRSDGLVKVLDFGLAKSVGESEKRDSALAVTNTAASAVTDPRIVLGTFNYISPEQASGRTADRRSDIFSFGVMLYEMLAGHLPFSGETAAERSLQNEVPDEIPDCPPKLAEIVSKALRKSAESRYQSMSEVRDDLRSLQANGRPEQAGARSPFAPGFLVFVGTFSIVALLLVGLWQIASRWTSGSAHFESLAVLPFANATGEPELDYVSEGIAESLTNRLSEFPTVRGDSGEFGCALQGRG